MSPAARNADDVDGASRRRRDEVTLAAIGLALLHVLLGLLLFEPTLFPGGDNAGYLILGEALRSGAGYRDLYLPGAPLHAKYPPVLPAILAVVGGIGGLQLAKLAMLACTAAVVWLTVKVGRGIVGGFWAVLAGVLLAVNPTLLEYGHYVLSEAPFGLFVLLALLAASREDGKGAALGFAAAAAAFLTRTAGLTLLLALPIAWAVRRRFRWAVAGAVAAVVVMTAWGAYQSWAAPAQAGYLQELALVDPYDPAAGSVGLAGLVARAASNLWAYASTVVPQTLFGPHLAGGASMLAGLALSLLALVGWAVRSRTHPGPAEMTFLLYGGLIAVWPSVWTDRRFLLPVLPLLLLFAVAAARRGLARFERRGRWVAAGLAAALALPAVIWDGGRVPERTACVASYRAGHPCDLGPYASFYAAARWARDNTPEDAIIANRKPRLFYWYANRRGDLYPYSADPEAVLHALDEMGASYVVVDQVSGTTVRYLLPAIQANPGRFEPAYQAGEPATFILRLSPAPVTGE